MIINNINNFNIIIDDEILENLKWLDAEIVEECLKEASKRDIEEGWISEKMAEGAGTEIYYYSEADEILEITETFEEIKEAAEISGACDEFDGDINSFKFKIANVLVWMFNSKEAYDVLEAVEVIDLEDEEFEFDELDDEVKEDIKESLRDDFVFNWCDAEQWKEYYNEELKYKHSIFNNLELKFFDLSYCQGDYLEFEGHINIRDLKILINDYRYKIFDVLDGYNTIFWWNEEDKKTFIKFVNRLDDDDRVEVNQGSMGINAVLYSDFWDCYDDREKLLEEFVKYLVREIQFDLMDDARNDIGNYIESNFEAYFECYVKEQKFNKHGDTID